MQEIMQFVSRHPVLSIAWIALLAAVLFTTFKSLTSKVKVITRGEATRLINKEDAVVVDLRQRDDFRKGHIAGSTNLLPSEIKANNVGELEKHKDKPLIVVVPPDEREPGARLWHVSAQGLSCRGRRCRRVRVGSPGALDD